MAIASAAAGLDPAALRELAQSAEIAARARATTAEFHDLKVTQRPAFVLESGIGDRAVFSGLVVATPLIATIDVRLNDTAAYGSFAAHFGAVPPQ